MNTRIISRYNYLSTNYNHFRQFAQTSNSVESEVFRSSLSSKIVSHFVHNSNSNSSHNLARQHFTRNVSKPVYHYRLNQFYLSILLHLRVRVTGSLGLATLCKRANFSSTVTSTCLWCLSFPRTLLTPPRFIP